MTNVVGVRFRNAGKIYFFSPGKLEISTGQHVIVETARGVEYGSVVLGPRDVEDDKVVAPLKTVIRIATPEDDETEAKNRDKEKEAFRICLEKIAKHNLDMKLIGTEYTFDNNIGVRDETKILGGIGVCGRPLCCSSYMADFIPVSIKMAKEQNLSLNPSKISGVCGRLMCCLKYEEDTYEYLNSRLPNVGDFVTTPEGLKGEVHSVNVLRQLVKVIVTVDGDDKDVREYAVKELKFKPKRRNEKLNINDDELKALEDMEKKRENHIN